MQHATQLQRIIEKGIANMRSLSKLKFTQSNIKCVRTFNCWKLELQKHYDNLECLCPEKMNEEESKLYYDGGYSPKQAIQSHARVPANIDLFTC